ncbi:MAG: SDR family oxidoreductase [Streptosporangiaceae bacterium]
MRREWRSALVTGASSGIGESFARLLAGRGTDLVLVARREDLLTRLAESLRDRVRVEVLAADLTDPDQLAVVERRVGAVDLLVNNAGYGAFGGFETISVADQVKEIELNVTALMRLTHAALPHMIANGWGGVLNVASVAGHAPSPGSAVYGATKAFVAAFSESLHTELRPRGVHVTELCPGFTRTEDDAATGLLWLARDRVAQAGLDAVAAGKARCVPGFQYKTVMPILRFGPRRLIRGVIVNLWGKAESSRSDKP